MSISAKVILDSINPHTKIRLITIQAKYPRFILAQLNTHRVFSRNTASSRAIPLYTIRQRVYTNPFIPLKWQENKKGMQGGKEVSKIKQYISKFVWLRLRDVCLLGSLIFDKLGIHKQIANRILENWLYTETVITSTDWVNFFKLRLEDDSAQPEIQKLAQEIYNAIKNSSPIEREWHLPYILDSEKNFDLENKLKMSCARCARVSFLLHDGTNPDLEKDYLLFTKLLAHRHMSPFEHQAKASVESKYFGNFFSWEQYRKLISNENYDSNISLAEYFRNE